MRKSLLQTRTLSILLFLGFIYSGMSLAQDKIYFNKDWLSCQKEDASYYRILEESDSLLKVTDYYVKGGMQSEGFIENTKKNREILKIRGDFEQKTIGDCKYFKKNGKLDYVVNMQPFHKTHGVDSKYLMLLDSLDTTADDTKNLSFEVSYFKRVTDFGFLIDEDKCHGTWVRVNAKSGKTIKTAHNYKHELNGAKIVYYPSGIIRREMNYKNGVLHGDHKQYNKKGVLVKLKEYENGMLMETWLYKKPKKKKS